MALYLQSSGLFCLLSVQTALVVFLSVSSPAAATLRFPQHYTMIHWAGRIEKELEKVLQLVTGGQQMK
ncbi:putative voltage-dependent calcium channel subunit alpha-2/delta-2, partial [Triplophysa rosa]